jgi:hypothetical protein
MLCNVFVVKFIPGVPTTIEHLYTEFGENIPKYLEYDGGSGLNILYCVDASTNIIEICDKYNVKVYILNTMEFDDSIYNNTFTIHPTYSDNGEQYELRSNENIELYDEIPPPPPPDSSSSSDTSFNAFEIQMTNEQGTFYLGSGVTGMYPES